MNMKYNLSLPELMDFFCDKEHCGFPLEEIEAAENRLEVLLPKTYRDFLLNYGKDAVNTHHNMLMEPQKIDSSYEIIQETLKYDWEPEFQEAMEQGLEAEYAQNPYFQLWKLPVECWETITEDYILIWHENQGIWSAGYRRKDLLNGVLNPPIYISTNDDYVTYKKCADNTEMFLVEMLYDAAYGWNDGERITNQAEIEHVLSDRGIDLKQLQAPSGNGTCFDGERLYFYNESGSYVELRIANRTLPKLQASFCTNQQLVLVSEKPLPTEYRPKYGPRHLVLSSRMQDLLERHPISHDGIPLHPLIAKLIQESFNRWPVTAYDWNKDIARIKTLMIKPRRDIMQVANERSFWILSSILPVKEYSCLPAPYYFDIHNWSVIGKMTKLQTLVIHDIYIDDFSFLKTCKNLKRLDLYNTNFSDCRLLAELTNLKEADLRFCPLEYVETLQNLTAKFLTKN